ncbi:MarC family protein [Pediococcus pentosaceus]|jgi:multiple antibiotic resistance protein|uniref:MarC family protein n=1 Tax=Pediococcus pentosaceus TaxID=1255 RepID=UPI00191AA6EC|nr:MarC family protein [Pediococcus pentosaceus]MCH4015500.1 MarC family protein [Pediococcus pentosaceus]MCH4059461.1 MarC family protein [Pediococcus pentosaceus]MCQ0028995.1 MarC family protein [Pediococcus pentosaceus]MCT3025575.1 MarC family protein [Pediococcus pentosaceus]MDD1389850.1 MarC family protein [Pediococcus pentosaceus]
MNLVQAFLLSFTAFFAIMNPFANLTMFVSLTADNSRKEVNAIARLAFIVATVIVALFALLGNYIFSIFGINLSALRIMGGIILGLIGYHMIQGNVSPIQHDPKQSVKDSINSNNTDVAISPLAMPVLAGPGTIATTMNLSSSTNPFIVISAFVVLSVITYFIFIYGEQIMAKLGNNIMNVITKLMGLILATIGVRMLIMGVQVAFHW